MCLACPFPKDSIFRLVDQESIQEGAKGPDAHDSSTNWNQEPCWAVQGNESRLQSMAQPGLAGLLLLVIHRRHPGDLLERGCRCVSSCIGQLRTILPVCEAGDASKANPKELLQHMR